MWPSVWKVRRGTRHSSISQAGENLERAGGALFGFFRHQLGDEHRQRPRHLIAVVVDVRYLSGDVSDEAFDWDGAMEGHLARDRLVEDTSERVEVQTCIEVLPLDALGRHVNDGAGGQTGIFDNGKDQRSHAEVYLRKILMRARLTGFESRWLQRMTMRLQAHLRSGE